MRIVAQGGELAKEMDPALKLAPSKATRETLRNVLLEATDDGLFVTGSDLTTTVRQQVLCAKVEGTGSILVPALSLSKALKGIGRETVELSIGKNLRCELVTDRSEFKIAGQHADDYPRMPEWIEDDAFDLPTEIVLAMAEQTKKSASQQHGRFSMNGVLVEIRKKRLRFVATDSHRLALCEHVGKFDTKSSVIVPVDGIELLADVAGDAETIRVRADELMFQVKGPTMTLSVRLVAGGFPPYERVIAQDNDIRIRFNRKEFLSTLSQATIFTTKKTNAVKFRFASGELVVSSFDGGEKESHIFHEIAYEGEEMVFGFNPEKMLDGVQAIQAEECGLELRDPGSVALFRDEEADPTFLYMIVPRNLSRV